MSPGSRYGGERWAVRAHVGLRWWSCPFDAVLAQMPATGRILDYGCGHGVLTGELAARPGAEVVGVDVDPAKIEVAARTLAGAARAEVVEPGAVPAGPWDGIAVVDVLYLLDRPARVELLERLAAELAPGGRMVVKEMDVTPRLKSAWMRAQERVMVEVLRVTKGAGLSFHDPAETVDVLRGLGLKVFARRVDRRYLHPHHIVVACS